MPLFVPLSWAPMGNSRNRERYDHVYIDSVFAEYVFPSGNKNTDLYRCRNIHVLLEQSPPCDVLRATSSSRQVRLDYVRPIRPSMLDQLTFLFSSALTIYPIEGD